jgi:carbon storage regulator
MLVLTRFRNESIVIGGNIKVQILEIQGGKVRLGIEAPKDVTVHRAEVQQVIDEEAKSA